MQAWAIRMANEGEVPNTETHYHEVQVTSKYLGRDLRVSARMRGPQLAAPLGSVLDTTPFPMDHEASEWVSAKVCWQTQACARDFGTLGPKVRMRRRGPWIAATLSASLPLKPRPRVRLLASAFDDTSVVHPAPELDGGAVLDRPEFVELLRTAFEGERADEAVATETEERSVVQLEASRRSIGRDSLGEPSPSPSGSQGAQVGRQVHARSWHRPTSFTAPPAAKVPRPCPGPRCSA